MKTFGLAFFFAVLHCNIADVASNAGKSFVQTFHYTDPTVEPLAVHAFHLSTDQSSPCEITITEVTSPQTSAKVTVSSGRPVEYQMPRNLPMVYSQWPPTYPPLRGVKLEAQCNFMVHGVNFFKSTADGWLGISVANLGSEYWVLNVPSNYDDPRQLSAVAVEDGTSCTTTFPNGTARKSSLKALGVDYMESNQDFTGTRIQCNKDVSVFSGQRCGVFPAGCRGCNHMVEQLLPKDALGRYYALAPISNQPCTTKSTCCSDPSHCKECMEFYRIVASGDNTRVLRIGTSGNENFMLKAGQSRLLAIPQNEYSVLLANADILIGQFSKGWAYQSRAQAPFFTLVQPIESYKTRYTFMACLVKATYRINVVIRNTKASALLLNGAKFLNGVTGHNIPSTKLAAFEHTLTCGGDKSFVVEHPEKETFGLLLYMETPTAGSYGYPVGLNFDTKQSILSVVADAVDSLAKLGLEGNKGNSGGKSGKNEADSTDGDEQSSSKPLVTLSTPKPDENSVSDKSKNSKDDGRNDNDMDGKSNNDVKDRTNTPTEASTAPSATTLRSDNGKRNSEKSTSGKAEAPSDIVDNVGDPKKTKNI